MSRVTTTIESTFTASDGLPSRSDRLPSVSALVPAWNEVERIAACVESLLAIDWPRFEILVSAGGEDGTYEVAERYAGERVIVVRQPPGLGKQAALRDLLGRASGEVIYLTDGDCVVPESTFRRVLEPIVRGEVAVVTGTYRPYRAVSDESLVLYQWSIDRAVVRRRGNGDESDGMTGANAAVARSALAAAGAFESEVATGTDYHLARRLRAAGYVIRYVDAAVETEYAVNPGDVLRRRSRWLRNIFLHGTRSGDRALVAAAMRTVALGLAFLVWPLTLPWTRRVGLGLWLAGFGTLIALRARYARTLAADRGVDLPSRFFVRLPGYTALDMIGCVLSIIHLLLPGRRQRW